jgi:hypothetical protein
MTDISLSGAFIHARNVPPPLAPIYVTLADSKRFSRSGAVVKAQVVRNSTGGFGIEWWQFAPAAVMKRIAGRAVVDPPVHAYKEGAKA